MCRRSRGGIRRPRNRCGQNACFAKTNAVQASHLDRIVFAECSAAHFHARGMGEFISHARSEERIVTMPLGRHELRSVAPRLDLQHFGGRRPVLPCVEDSVRRPQRPGNQFAPKRFLEEPPGNSPSRIARNRRLCRNARQGIQNISLDGRTLRLARARFKQKSRRHCAETVNASVSLWKALEKRNEFHFLGNRQRSRPGFRWPRLSSQLIFVFYSPILSFMVGPAGFALRFASSQPANFYLRLVFPKVRCASTIGFCVLSEIASNKSSRGM